MSVKTGIVGGRDFGSLWEMAAYSPRGGNHVCKTGNGVVN